MKLIENNKSFVCVCVSLWNTIEVRCSTEVWFKDTIRILPNVTMDENYLTSILDCTEQCCKLLLCSLWFVEINFMFDVL